MRIRILNEIAGLLRGGQRADHVEIGAADEHRVGAEDGLDAQRRQLGENELVDLTGGSRAGRDFRRCWAAFFGVAAPTPIVNNAAAEISHVALMLFQLRAGDTSFRLLASDGVILSPRMPVCGGTEAAGGHGYLLAYQIGPVRVQWAGMEKGAVTAYGRRQRKLSGGLARRLNNCPVTSGECNP